MTQKDYLGIVPPQTKGKEIEVHAAAELKNNIEAGIFYELAKQRLLNVNKWHETAGVGSAVFKAFNKNGNPVDRNIENGDYIRIDIPGPGSKAGKGYDWVLVEELKKISSGGVQSVGFRVRPVANPNGNAVDIAHFYNSSSTSNFTVTREANVVNAVIVDRNLQPNDDVESLTDKIRHTSVAMGAIGMFSKAQWQNLAEGIIERPEVRAIDRGETVFNSPQSKMKELVGSFKDEKNVDVLERIISAGAGVALMKMGISNIRKSTVLSCSELILGGFLLFRGVTAYCPVRDVLEGRGAEE